MNYPLQRVHLVGIGGSGIQGLATFLKEQAVSVSGSDLNPVQFSGIQTYSPHQVAPLEKIAPQLVVYSPAVPENNIEVQWALKNGIEIHSYPEQVGLEMKKKVGIAVAGTHGKSTTSSLITQLLFREGRDPSFIIGAKVFPFEKNGHYGNGQEMVVEACEYQKSFLSLHYQFAVINNIEADHLDYYQDLKDITQSFKEFARKLNPGGTLFLPEALREEFQTLPITICTVGNNNKATYRWNRLKMSPEGCEFFFKAPEEPWHKCFLPLFGRHNISNATMALAVVHQLGVPLKRVISHLAQVRAPARRFQIHQLKPVVIIEDFAHHPTKITRTLEACRQRFPDQKIYCIFQPHQHHRTRVLLKEFAESLVDVHECLIPPIFAARDTVQEKARTQSPHLVQAILQAGGRAQYFASLEEMKQYLEQKIQKASVILVLGAGNIGEIVAPLMKMKIPYLQKTQEELEIKV
ncbi:MAG: UDP-N-acetylmuramate--L-alanine ligase [Planctomycetota bacterium]